MSHSEAAHTNKFLCWVEPHVCTDESNRGVGDSSSTLLKELISQNNQGSTCSNRKICVARVEEELHETHETCGNSKEERSVCPTAGIV